jgi:hypothetical protein
MMAVHVAHHVTAMMVVPHHVAAVVSVVPHVVVMAVHAVHADGDHVGGHASRAQHAWHGRRRGRSTRSPEGSQDGDDEQGLPHGVSSPICRHAGRS